MPEITVNGTKLHYKVNGEGHPFIFIHAGGMDSSSWDAQVDYFSTKYQVITYDLRGHGRSGIPERGYTVGDCVEDLRQMVDLLDIQQPYLAGLSMGGYIALSFTLNYPDKVDALILAGTNCGPVTDTVVKIREEMAGKIEAIKGSDVAINYIRAYEANLDRPDLTCRLSELKMPVLIIVGDKDMESPQYISEDMHSRIADSEIAVLSNCGHRCHQEQPEKYNNIVSDFLQGLEND